MSLPTEEQRKQIYTDAGSERFAQQKKQDELGFEKEKADLRRQIQRAVENGRYTVGFSKYRHKRKLRAWVATQPGYWVSKTSVRWDKQSWTCCVLM